VGRRLLRVNESVKEVVSRAIGGGELSDPRMGFVTVTGVETSPDLRHARVYVSVLGGERQRNESLAALRAAHGYLQAQVAAAVRLKRTPQLEFIYDETTDKAMRIGTLLSEHVRELEQLGVSFDEPPEGETGEAHAADETAADHLPDETAGEDARGE
jgi:ribosome-binding factor A